MCVISMVMDRYDKLWPWPTPTITPDPNTVPITPTWPVPNVPLTPVVPETNWTITTLTATEKTALEAFEELCAAAKKLDEILGLPDCEDPRKAEWLEAVRQRVREHEVAKIEKRLNP